MMSSGLDPLAVNNSVMPGNYESFPAPGARGGLFADPISPLEPEPMIPPVRTPFPQLRPTLPSVEPSGSTPFPRLPPGTPAPALPIRGSPMVPRVRLRRPRRHRRRPLTPEIVIERRPHHHHHRHHHSSSGRHHVIRVPLDHRPTLGLRGPPKRVLEIERVRCHRRRRSPTICYEYDYDDPPLPVPWPHPPAPVPAPSQPPIIIVNPAPAAVQPAVTVPMNHMTPAAVTTANVLSTLTPETINNLPRQMVHLPPIHLPGSHADANTELDTVILPAELLNPADGTLSIIQTTPGVPNVVTPHIQSMSAAPLSHHSPVHPPVINISRPANTPIIPGGTPMPSTMGSDPLMNRFQQLFQRFRLPSTQPRPSLPTLAPFRPRLPTMSQFDPSSSLFNNPAPTGPPISSTNMGGNFQLPNPLSTGSFRPTNLPTSTSATNMTYRPPNPVSSNPLINTSYRPSTFTPSAPTSNIPYRPSTFTPSAPTNNATYRPMNLPPSNIPDIGPYAPANITPYTNLANRSSTNNPLPQSSFSSGPGAYTSTSSITPSSTFTPFPRLSSTPSGYLNNPINSLANQSTNSMPKSILRNPLSSSTPFPNTNNTYTSFNALP